MLDDSKKLRDRLEAERWVLIGVTTVGINPDGAEPIPLRPIELSNSYPLLRRRPARPSLVMFAARLPKRAPRFVTAAPRRHVSTTRPARSDALFVVRFPSTRPKHARHTTELCILAPGHALQQSEGTLKFSR
jgi:hypothetical protein